MNELLTGLVIARCPHEAGGGGQLVAGAERVTAACFDLLAHPRPFLEPCSVIADPLGERAADTIDLIDLNPGPRCRRQTDQQAHRPTVIARKIEECGIVPFSSGMLAPWL